MDFGKLLAIAAAVALGLFFWDSAALFPLKLLVVLIHESGHALAAKAVGGQVVSISIDQFQGGLCRFAVAPGKLNEIVTSSAGYLGSALGGAAMLYLTLRLNSGKAVLFGLAAMATAVGGLWARTPFTLAVCAGLAIAFFAAARWLPETAGQLLAFFVAVFCGLYALFDLKDDLWSGARRAHSDAGLLARATHVPSAFWAGLWTLLAVAMLGFAISRGARSSGASRSPALKTRAG